MEPSEEDLRVARAATQEWSDYIRANGGNTSFSPFAENLINRIASMRAAEREKAAKGDVNAALAELREMFPDNELTIDFAARPDGWQQVSIFRFAPSTFRDTILVAQGPTISEAMASIRAGDKE